VAFGDGSPLAGWARPDPLRRALVAAIEVEGAVRRLRAKVGGGLWYWVQQEVLYPTVQAYRDFLVNVMIPNWTFFGWMTLITETFIGATLMLGLFTRLGSLVAIGMALNITIGIVSVPHEWVWTYVMLIMLPVIFLFTDAGRSFGLDSFIAPRLDRAAADGHRLGRLLRWLV
jgi:thiosulfate dehydrogenase (quinone) large subunit